MNKLKSKILLGIDPGLSCTGFGIMHQKGAKTLLLDHGYLKLDAKQHLSQRIAIFFDFFQNKIDEFKIDNVALETPFLGKNAQNFLKLGYLRGILYLLAAQHNMVIHEFAPRQVKLSITGWGGADKDQVARVVLQFFPHIKKPKYNDVTDALAITLCGLWNQKITC